MKIYKNGRKGVINIALIFTLFILMISNTILADAMTQGKEEIMIQSPPTVGVLPILWMKENDVLSSKAEIKVRISPEVQQSIALIAKKDIDMMVTGVNVGAKIFNQGIDVRLLNTNIWAIDYLLTYDFKADSWSDLEGKTMSLPLKGGPLDFLARYFLQENGVDPEKVEMVYKPLNNGAKTFQLGKLDSIIIPEPLVTVTLKKTEKAYLSFDLQKEWAKLHNGEERIPYVGLFVRGDFAGDNRELVEDFNDYYKKGVDWVHENPDEAAKLAAEYFNMPAPIIKASFQRVNLNYYPAGESYQLIETYFNEIIKLYPDMIGGKLPNELFYF